MEGLTEAKRVASLANVDEEDGGGGFPMIPVDDQDDSIMNDYPSGGADGAGRKYTDEMDIASKIKFYQKSSLIIYLDEGRQTDQVNPLQRYNHGAADNKPSNLKKFGSTQAGGRSNNIFCV